MRALLSHVSVRPRLYVAAAIGVAAALLMPHAPQWATRPLVGWNAAVWTYLVLIGVLMSRADHHWLRRTAVAQAQGAALVLGVVTIAAAASVTAIVIELAAAKHAPGALAWPHLAFAGITVVGAWVLVPVMFALDYASRYYRESPPGGLNFPDGSADFHPDYTDFLYFSFTIAVASQTADVSIGSRSMRQLVLLQSVLSFAFNTAILALTINIAAGLLN